VHAAFFLQCVKKSCTLFLFFFENIAAAACLTRFLKFMFSGIPLAFLFFYDRRRGKCVKIVVFE